MITALDEAVGNVSRALKASGRYRDTAILFLSDNGGASRGQSGDGLVDLTGTFSHLFIKL